jgi:hypothetical protein
VAAAAVLQYIDVSIAVAAKVVAAVVLQYPDLALVAAVEAVAAVVQLYSDLVVAAAVVLEFSGAAVTAATQFVAACRCAEVLRRCLRYT